ncbi:hypothetical protein J2T57_002625 [Natronocella acetinitrilica]|uniref:Uncharacterized protein n=1 Tax=Natronocella acetinitrilica TaxID=414046 RepID=A0AAE3G463_9GAMM|nr:hypothetical protein [Natronocella acetinitrilica]
MTPAFHAALHQARRIADADAKSKRRAVHAWAVLVRKALSTSHSRGK